MVPKEPQWNPRKKRIDPKRDAACSCFPPAGAKPPAYRSEKEANAAVKRSISERVRNLLVATATGAAGKEKAPENPGRREEGATA